MRSMQVEEGRGGRGKEGIDGRDAHQRRASYSFRGL
jgi:hypothetical protein